MNGGLSGKRILIVEDEALIALSLEEIVTAAGGAVVGTAYSRDRALELARMKPPLDAAVIDLNLAGESGEAVADLLREQGIPYVFLTGYGRKGISARHSGLPVVTKPFDASAVIAALAKVMPVAA